MAGSESPGGAAALRARASLVVLLVAVAGVAWWTAAQRMAGMDPAPGADLGTLTWFVVTWTVMMAAMMFPSVSPTVALYARMAPHRGGGRALVFTAAYLLVWGAAGVVAYAVVQAGASLTGAASRMTWDGGGHGVAAGVLLFAAVYELSPLKHVCLAKCRSPLGFLLGSWRDGRRGALQMGAHHAAWCIGCCWALMAVLFALGVMSIAWMAVVAALITAEKLLPWRRVATVSTAAVLAGLGVAVAAFPQVVASPGM